MSEIKLHRAPQRWPLVLIALDKLIKAIGLVVISFALSPYWYDVVKVWVNDAQTTPHNWLIADGVHWLGAHLGLNTKELHLLRVCVIIYAGLYLIEGVGLFYERKWAEWMVVIGTAGFLPLEIYDFAHKPMNDTGQVRWGMIILFLLNLLMAGYLVWRLHRQRIIKHERMALGLPPEPPKKEGFPVGSGKDKEAQ